jgi:hypothetical protein
MSTETSTNVSQSPRWPSGRTDTPTQVIECACVHCAEYAEREGLTLPLRAEVNVSMLAAVKTKMGRHNLVQMAVAPIFGRYSATQIHGGPWAV